MPGVSLVPQPVEADIPLAVRAADVLAVVSFPGALHAFGAELALAVRAGPDLVVLARLPAGYLPAVWAVLKNRWHIRLRDGLVT